MEDGSDPHAPRDVTAYGIWVSEVMLQQTRADSVIPYWRRFLEAFPTPAALASRPVEDLLDLWAGLGYYARARHLHAAARRVVEVHAGSTVLYDDWRDVDGVLAPYRFTASAFCGERALRHDRMAAATKVVFNDVTVEEVVPPTDLVDLADLLAEP